MSVLPDKILIKEIELVEFTSKKLRETNVSTKLSPHLTIELQHELNAEDKVLHFIYEGKLQLTNQEKQPLYESDFNCKFIVHVENLDDFKKYEDNIERYDQIIALTCIGITYSTLRGILVVKLLGTPLEHYMLPVIDPKSLMG